MPFKIDDYIKNATDKALKTEMSCIHDDLLSAYKIIESIQDACDLSEKPSESVLLAVFSELRKIPN